MANSFFSLERAQSHSYFPLETFSGLCYHLNSAKAWFKRVTGKNHTREYTSNKTLQMLQAYQFCPSMALLNLLYSNHKDSPALKKMSSQPITGRTEDKDSMKWDWEKANLLLPSKLVDVERGTWNSPLQHMHVLLLPSQLSQRNVPLYSHGIKVQTYSKKI